MAANLTGQVRGIADVVTAVATGDLSKKITVTGRRRDAGAEIHHQHNGRSAELLRLGSDPCGARGGLGRKARGQAQVQGVAGTWKDLTDNVNMMAANLTGRCATSRT
jgi:HAMP domain-containing protein